MAFRQWCLCCAVKQKPGGKSTVGVFLERLHCEGCLAGILIHPIFPSVIVFLFCRPQGLCHFAPQSRRSAAHLIRDSVSRSRTLEYVWPQTLWLNESLTSSPHWPSSLLQKVQFTLSVWFKFMKKPLQHQRIDLQDVLNLGKKMGTI